MKILVTGGSGFLGRALCATCVAQGHEVHITSRSPRTQIASVVTHAWNYREEPPPAAALAEAACVVHLMGDNIGEGRWSEGKKRELRASRIDSGKRLVAALPSSVHTFVGASAIGYYPSDTRVSYDEAYVQDGAGSFMEDLCREWEAVSQTARTPQRRVAIPRIGVVLGAGGMLARLAPIYKLGAGGAIGSGTQDVPWIHIEDAARAIATIIAKPELEGPVNIVGPRSATLAQISRAIARALHRPDFVRVPGFAARLLLGEASALVLGSYNIVPKRLTEVRFTWQFGELEMAVADALARL